MSISALSALLPAAMRRFFPFLFSSLLRVGILLFNIIFFIFKLLLIYPLVFLTRSCGLFIGLCWYAAYFMILFYSFIMAFQHLASNVPWKDMVAFHNLSRSQQAKIIDMAELAAYVYDPEDKEQEHFKALQAKGYTTLEEPHINAGGLTYATLQKDNTIYLAFRGSITPFDFIVDIAMICDLTTTDNERFTSARGVAGYFLTRYPDKNLVLVGHSLGGSMVQYVLASLPNSRIKAAYTFNPIGIPDGIERHPSNKLIDVIQEADIAQLVMGKKHVVGQGIILRQTYKGTDPGLTDLISQHSIENAIKNMKRQH